MSRIKKVLKWTAVTVAVAVASLLIVSSVLSWLAGRRLEAKLELLRAGGYPIRLTDLRREPIDPDANAWIYLEPKAEELKALVVEFSKLKRKLDKKEIDQSEYLDRMNSLLDAEPAIIAAIDKAANCDDLDPKIDFEGVTFGVFGDGDWTEKILGVLNEPIYACHIELERSRRLASEGNIQAAARAVLNVLRFASQVERQPTTLSMQKANGMRAEAIERLSPLVASEELPDELRKRIEIELAEAESSQAIVNSLASERALGLDIFRAFFSGMMRWNWLFKDDACDYIDMMQAEMTLAAYPSYDKLEERRALRERIAELGPLTRQVSSSIERGKPSIDSHRAKLRSLRVLNALMMSGYKPPDFAAALRELLRLPEEATTDPYTGKPLVIKTTDKGWIVYARGPNLVDDGGNFGQWSGEKGTDVGVTSVSPSAETSTAENESADANVGSR